MTAAALTASAAILKERYADGKLPKANYQNFPFVSMVPKWEKWTGDNFKQPLQTENPQGVGAGMANALGSVAQGKYYAFKPDRVEYDGVARLTGHAIKAAEGNEGALVNLWTNETDGISQSLLKMAEIQMFGTGNGVLGTISSGQGTVTITLTTAEDIANFDLGMRVQLVSDLTLSPTIRAGTPATVTGVSRDLSSATVTIATVWTTQFAGASAGDSIVRAGDAAVSATATVMYGARKWLEGGSSPGTFWTVTRNDDPVRLASQLLNATTIPMEDALIDLESLITFQGQMDSDKVLIANPRDVRQLKKSLGGKVTYPRTEMKGSGALADISFKAIEFEGDSGTIKIVTSPFCPKANAFLGPMSAVKLASLGPLPHLLNYDGPDFLRVASDNAFEVRFGWYANPVWSAPSKWARMTNWGA